MDLNEITKCEFERAYARYAPSKIEKFYFKYFSQNTLEKHIWLKWLIVSIMFIPFVFAFIGTVNNGSHQLIEIFTFIFCGLIISFAIPWIYVWFAHNCRIKKIQKKLGINKDEYEILIDKFYNEVDIDRYIKNKACQ
ncbi:MAG: hypothetical protein WC554_12340 [Clostridia bacterium]